MTQTDSADRNEIQDLRLKLKETTTALAQAKQRCAYLETLIQDFCTSMSVTLSLETKNSAQRPPDETL